MALAFDASSTSNAKSATSVTWSHTCSTSADRVLVVTVNQNDETVLVSSVTYAGAALTQSIRQDAGGGRPAEIWYKLAPATGANNIVVTLASADQQEEGGVSFTGGNAVNGAVGTETPSGTTYSVTVTTASGNYCVATCTTGNRTFSGQTPGCTEWYNVIPATGDQRGEGHYIAATGATQVMTITISSAAASAFAAVNVAAGSQVVNSAGYFMM